MNRAQVAEILEEIALLLELQGENPFKTRAYVNGARAVLALDGDLAEIVRADRLREVPGIGEALAKKIAELVATGRLEYYEKLRAAVDPGMLELVKVPGVGPKKARALHDHLGISSVEALERACLEHRVGGLAGFGAKSEVKILEAIQKRRTYQGLHRMEDVLPVAEEIVEALRACPAVVRCTAAGSVRRGKEITKDLDLLASTKTPAAVMDFFVKLPQVEQVGSRGDTKASVTLAGGLACDLRVVPDADYATALHHFTGSKEHNVAMRHRALARSRKLSEWGLFDTTGDAERKLKVRTEEELFAALGLDYIPPELRENMGEIEAAEEGRIPRLVEWTELRGTFHCHTTASDGRDSLEQMAAAADELGLEYLGIADHSRSQVQAKGLTEERLLEQVAAIRELNQAARWDIHLLAGCEVDILKDGKLDFDDAVLAHLDYVVASVHGILGLDEETMTRRIVRAMENERVTILGHPTGRLLLARDAYACSIEKILDCAAETGTWIELNASGWRLDLDWRWWRRARDRGVKCAINPDAHGVEEFGCLRIGAMMARKGWLRREDVINCLPWEQMRNVLAQPKPARR